MVGSLGSSCSSCGEPAARTMSKHLVISYHLAETGVLRLRVYVRDSKEFRYTKTVSN